MPSPRDYYALIGRIVVKTARMEDTIRYYVGLMASDDYELIVRITAGMRWPELSRILKSLFVYRIDNEAIKDKFLKTMGRLDSLNDKRATYVHSRWTIEARDQLNLSLKGKVLRTKYNRHAKRGLKVDSQLDEIEDLKKFLDDLEHEVLNLARIMGPLQDTIIRHRQFTSDKTSIGWGDDGIPSFSSPRKTAKTN